MVIGAEAVGEKVVAGVPVVALEKVWASGLKAGEKAGEEPSAGRTAESDRPAPPPLLLCT